MSKEYFYSFDSSYNDYYLYTENDISEVTKNGVLLKNGTLIDFCSCADNYKNMHINSSEKCIGERFAPTFVFYTKCKPTKLVFLHKNKLFEFFSPIRNRVYAFQKAIRQFGFDTYDMT